MKVQLNCQMLKKGYFTLSSRLFKTNKAVRAMRLKAVDLRRGRDDQVLTFSYVVYSTGKAIFE